MDHDQVGKLSLMRRCFAVSLATLLLAATGCGDSSPAPPAATTNAKPVNANAVNSRKLRSYLRESFGIPGLAADWYPDVRRVRVEGMIAYIETEYFNDADVTESSRAMCTATAQAALPEDDPTVPLGLVRVLDRDGRSIMQCGPRTPPA